MDWDYSIIGSNIKFARKAKPGMTQEKLGKKIGLSKQWISKIEAGEFKYLSPYRLKEIASILKIELEKITKGAEKTNEKHLTKLDIKEAVKEAVKEAILEVGFLSCPHCGEKIIGGP